MVVQSRQHDSHVPGLQNMKGRRASGYLEQGLQSKTGSSVLFGHLFDPQKAHFPLPPPQLASLSAGRSVTPCPGLGLRLRPGTISGWIGTCGSRFGDIPFPENAHCPYTLSHVGCFSRFH